MKPEELTQTLCHALLNERPVVLTSLMPVTVERKGNVITIKSRQADYTITVDYLKDNEKTS